MDLDRFQNRIVTLKKAHVILKYKHMTKRIQFCEINYVFKQISDNIALLESCSKLATSNGITSIRIKN